MADQIHYGAGSGAADALDEILTKRKMEARQLMLDQLNAANVQSEIQTRQDQIETNKMWRAAQAEALKSQAHERETKNMAMGQDLPPDVAQRWVKEGFGADIIPGVTGEGGSVINGIGNDTSYMPQEGAFEGMSGKEAAQAIEGMSQGPGNLASAAPKVHPDQFRGTAAQQDQLRIRTDMQRLFADPDFMSQPDWKKWIEVQSISKDFDPPAGLFTQGGDVGVYLIDPVSRKVYAPDGSEVTGHVPKGSIVRVMPRPNAGSGMPFSFSSNLVEVPGQPGSFYLSRGDRRNGTVDLISPRVVGAGPAAPPTTPPPAGGATTPPRPPVTAPPAGGRGVSAAPVVAKPPVAPQAQATPAPSGPPTSGRGAVPPGAPPQPTVPYIARRAALQVSPQVLAQLQTARKNAIPTGFIPGTKRVPPERQAPLDAAINAVLLELKGADPIVKDGIRSVLSDTSGRTDKMSVTDIIKYIGPPGHPGQLTEDERQQLQLILPVLLGKQ